RCIPRIQSGRQRLASSRFPRRPARRPALGWRAPPRAAQGRAPQAGRRSPSVLSCRTRPAPGNGNQRPGNVVIAARDCRTPGRTATTRRLPVPLTMYTTSWCGFCKRLKAQLGRVGVEITEVDIERDEAAAEFVMSVNGGNQTVPTLLFP